MVSTYIWVDTIASSDGVRKVCCPDGYARQGQDAKAAWFTTAARQARPILKAS